MRVSITSWQKCPVCNGSFVDTGRALVCPQHKTIPSRYLLRWYYRHEEFKASRDPDADYSLTSYSLALRLGIKIEGQIADMSFDPIQYKGRRSKVKTQSQFLTLYDEWVGEQQRRLKNGEIAPAYFVKIKHCRAKFEKSAVLRDADVRAIRTREVRRFKDELADTGLSQGAQQNILGVLRRFLAGQIQDEVISIMPKFPRFEMQEKEGRAVDAEYQIKGLACVEDAYRPAIMFLFETGLRQSNVRAVMWDDIRLNAEEPHIVIDKGFSDNVLLNNTKEHNIGFVPLTPKIRDILNQSQRFVGCPFIFHNNGKAFTKNVLPEAWQRACKRAGIEYIPLHQTGRHTFITRKQIEGHDMRSVGMAVMHKTLESTKRYTHLPKLEVIRKVYE